MFGLMRFRAKAPAALPAQHQRLHYCGVCKAMGRQYGQRTRLALNYDAIFLSELLTFISGTNEDYQQEWAPALLSYNCLRLPKREDIPTPLSYAASVNVLLAGIKLQDNVEDRGGFVWRTAQHLYQSKVEKAEKDLQAHGLDLEAIDQWLREHARREKAPAKAQGKTQLAYMAEATARITGLVFRTGAEAVGKGEEGGKMEMLGRDFGKMIYLLDAYRDVEKDYRKGEYNPIQAAYGMEGKEMTEEVRENVQQMLLQTAQLLLDNLQALPISLAQQTWFRERIEENLKEQLGLSAAEIRSCTTAPSKKPRRKISFATRWQFLRNLAQTWHLPRIRQRNGYWRTAFTFGAVGFLALLFPTFLHARADFFTFVDPDFLTRFGDLHPDWLPDGPQADNCACTGPNGRCCCDTCCNNCTRECNETCDRIITIFFTLLAIFGIGIVTMIIFIVQGRRRAAQKEAERHNAQYNQRQAPPPAPFRTVVQRPGRDTEVLLAAAHDWFGKHYPGAMPLLKQAENHRTLEAEGHVNIQTNKSGQSQDLGRVVFRIQLHVRPEALALEFDGFEHMGGPGIAAGGQLNQAGQVPVDPQSWWTIKQQTAAHLRGQLSQFQHEV